MQPFCSRSISIFNLLNIHPGTCNSHQQMDMTNHFALLRREVSPGCSPQTHHVTITAAAGTKSGVLSLVPGFSWFGLSRALTVHPTSQHGVVQMAMRPQKPIPRASRSRGPTPVLSPTNQKLCSQNRLI